MTERENTPKPWHFHGGAIHARYTDKNGGAQHHMVAEALPLSVEKYGNEGDVEANARLIAAAPDLLEACEALISKLRRISRDCECGCEPFCICLGGECEYCKAEAAIAKANL